MMRRKPRRHRCNARWRTVSRSSMIITMMTIHTPIRLSLLQRRMRWVLLMLVLVVLLVMLLEEVLRIRNRVRIGCCMIGMRIKMICRLFSISGRLLT